MTPGLSASPNPGPVSIRRLLVYAACVIAPWTAIGIACILASGCVSDLMQAGATPVVPPRFAFYLADPDKFARPAHEKDCNDYAVERAARLRAEGLAPYFVVAIAETGEGHMVTAIDHNGETLIYDNRLPEPDKPIPWRHLHYRWIEREGAGHVWYPIINAGG
jgi:Bacterial transglutaminase-like cysteine proteinase BTLCP